MPQMGKLYLGDIDVTYMFMGEQCVYELVQETGGTASVTFSFLNSSLVCPIAIMTTDGTIITTLTTAPYTYTATGGDRIKWSAATATGGNYYKAEGSLTIIGTKTQNIDMVPYYTVTFNWITPTTPGYAEAFSYGNEWYVSGATRFKSGATVNWNASADGYNVTGGTFVISGNSVIDVELTRSGYDYQPLTFKILTGGTITWRATSTSETISYSTNRGTTWTNVTAGPSAQLGTFSAGQEVWVKGVNTSYEPDTFGGTAYFNLEGNLASLINGDSFSATTPSITTNRVFFNLFSGSNVVSATNMIIPFGSVPASGYAGMFKNCTAMTLVPACRTSELSNGCYESMFEGCTSIRTALPLPTRTLAQGCYRNMFKGCTSLITVGGLSASTLQASCYYGMFSGCTSLSATPLTSASTMANSACTYMFAGCSSLTSINMPKATTLSQDCYRGMFVECTSLTTPPTLSATTLGVRCYAEMFRGCSNLTSVPALSVTTLATGCYESMFEDCTSITTVPALPATAMTEGCYAYMFAGCIGLTGAPTLNATSLNTRCYQGMFAVCRSLTTAPALPATTLTEECYSYMFYGCTALTSAPQLMAATLVDGCYEYMFYNCNRLTELWVYATSGAGVTANTNNWVSGITTSGTLHVPQGMSSTWPTGASRRPVNWTVSEPTQTFSYSIRTTQAGCTVVINGVTKTTNSTAGATYTQTGSVSDVRYSVTKSGYVGEEGPISNGQTITVTLDPEASYSYSITTTQSGCTVVINGVTKTSSSTAGGTYTYTSNTSSSFSYSVSKTYWETETGTISANQTKTITLWGDYQIFVTPYVGLELSVGVNSEDEDIIGPITKEVGGEDNDRWLCTVPYQALRPATINFTQNGYTTESFTLNASTPIGDGAENVVTLQPVVTQYQLKVIPQLENAASISMPITFNYTYNGAASSTTMTGSTLVIQADQNTTVSYTMKRNGFKEVTDSFTITGNTTKYETIYPYYLERPLTIRNNGSSNATITIQTNDRSNIAGDISVDIKSSYTGGSESYTNIQASSQTITIAAGKMAEIYTTNNEYKPTYSRYIKISGTGNLVAEGNVASLLSGTSVSNLVASSNITPPTYAFTNLFNGCTALTSVEHVRLPFKTASSNCYYYMFFGCTNISGETAAMNATQMGSNSCYYMYYNCRGITAAAILATTMSSNCFTRMFQNCSSLASIFYAANSAPSTTYNSYWVSGVSSSGTFSTSGTWTAGTRGVSAVPSNWTFNNNQIAPSMDI